MIAMEIFYNQTKGILYHPSKAYSSAGGITMKYHRLGSLDIKNLFSSEF